MKLNEKLKERRMAKGLSQAELAKVLNISRQSISKWENGKNYPDLDNLHLLSVIYEVSLDDLLKKEEPEASKKRVKDSTA